MNAEIDDIESNDVEQEFFEHFKIIIDKGQEPLRIDKFLQIRIANSTRTKIQNAADAGNIFVNGKAVKSNYKVKPFDEISIVLPHPPREIELIPEDIPLDIVYEDEDLIIVNKKPGMVVHPAYGNYSGTLVNALAFHFQNLPKKSQKISSNQEIPRPGLVHRIDKNTSGIILIAKTELAMTKMAKDFFDKNLDRRYQALVWGNIVNDSGTIDINVGRSLKNRKVMDTFSDSETGKRAVTHYKVLERFGYVTLVECKLETGRTHQIRVHLKSLGHPLFNDVEYGGDKILKGLNSNKYKQFVENCFSLCPRQALHAKSLEIFHPADGKKILFDSQLPNDMNDLILKWRNYFSNKGTNHES